MKADRARQFLPFAALRGFDGMLREIEKQSVPKKELTEEELRLLNEKIKVDRQRIECMHCSLRKKCIYRDKRNSVFY